MTETDNKPKGGIIHSLKEAWLIILLGLLYGTALAGVQVWLKPKIEANKARKTLKAIPDIFGTYTDAKQTQVTGITNADVAGQPGSKIASGAGEFLALDAVIKDPKGRDVKITKVFDQAGTHIGWLIPASGSGYADTIELLIGVDAKVEHVKGIYILAQKETPGLGSKIVTPDFRQSYRDAGTDQPLVVVKHAKEKPQEIQAISGATVSSDSVTTIVNTAIAVSKDEILKLGQP